MPKIDRWRLLKTLSIFDNLCRFSVDKVKELRQKTEGQKRLMIISQEKRRPNVGENLLAGTTKKVLKVSLAPESGFSAIILNG